MEHFLVDQLKEIFKQDNKFTDIIYNLQGLENLKGVSKHILDETYEPIIQKHFKKDIQEKEIHPRFKKLLKYKPGSYASVHTDNLPEDILLTWTSVTMIDRSDDLIGGDTIINGISQNLDIGETVWYPAGTPHGVTKLYQGYRNVLVILWTSIYLTE